MNKSYIQILEAFVQLLSVTIPLHSHPVRPYFLSPANFKDLSKASIFLLLPYCYAGW